jgi:hypothetical protein
VLGVLSLTTFGIAGPASASTATSAGACGWTPANDSRVAGTFSEPGVNIRNDRWTTCPILGEGYPGQSVDIRCYATGTTVDGESHWDYVTDETTGVTGWVSELYLTGFGAVVPC